MEMIRGLAPSDIGVEGEVYSVLFQRFFSLVSEDGDIDFMKRCVACFNALEASVIDHLCQASARYCNAFLSEVGEPPIAFSTPRKVLEFVTPSVLVVPYPEQSIPVVHLELECQWEPEHGMEWVIREDRVLYVGPFNGEDPWGTFTPRTVWNFA